MQFFKNLSLLDYMAGPAEPGVQGVQLHTHFLASSFIKDQILFQKMFLHTKLHNQILVVSTGSGVVKSLWPPTVPKDGRSSLLDCKQLW